MHCAAALHSWSLRNRHHLMLGKDLAAVRLVTAGGAQSAVAAQAEQCRFDLLCPGSHESG